MQGPAPSRARLAAAIVEERLAIISAPVTELRSTLIGLDSVDRTGRPPEVDPREVRLRVVGRSASAEAAALIGREVEALYTNGPFGGGGATAAVRPVLAVASTLIPASQVRTAITLVEA